MRLLPHTHVIGNNSGKVAYDPCAILVRGTRTHLLNQPKTRARGSGRPRTTTTDDDDPTASALHFQDSCGPSLLSYA